MAKSRKDQDLSRQLQEATRKEEELLEQQLRERHRFMIDRLLSDVRFFSHAMEEFVELPQEMQAAKPWDKCVKEMMDEAVKHSHVLAPPSDAPPSLEPIVTLLNFRDKVLSTMLTGALYRKACLDVDFGTGAGPAPQPGPQAGAPPATGHASAGAAGAGAGAVADPAGGVMAELTALAKQARLKSAGGGTSSSDFSKYPLRDLPSAGEAGHFTYDHKKQQHPEGQETAQTEEAQEHSLFHNRIGILLEEMSSMDKALRQMKFGRQTKISQTLTIPSEELRSEIAKVFDKCSRLEHELQMSKAQRHAALDVQLDGSTRKCDDADREIKKNVRRVMKLESDVTSLKAESTAIRREKLDLAEKYEAIASEHLPVLDKIDRELSKLRESVDQRIADAQMLSQMFKMQVEDNIEICKQRDEKARELVVVNSTLRRERLKNQLKDIELGKKETLHQRTIEAREETHNNYKQGKVRIQEARDRLRKKEEEWERLADEVRKRDDEIARLQGEMHKATMTVDELEQQKKECMKEFQAATGRPYAMLLEQCKAKKKVAED